MRNYLLATDGSNGAARACDVAVEFAKATGGKLLILTVGQDLSRQEAEEISRAEGDIGAVLERISDEILQHAEQ